MSNLEKKGASSFIEVRTSKGFLMELEPSNYIDSIIQKEGYYESEVLDSLLESTDKHCCFWDIGANIGIHSLGFKFLRPESTVVSFEPDVENFLRLKRNCVINNLSLSLMNFPLSDRLELTKIFSAQGNHGRSTLTPWGKGDYRDDPSFVFCSTGDYLVGNRYLPIPDLIKLDVEGYELNVIKGLSLTLGKKQTSKIVFEAPYSFLDTSSELKSVLISIGYKLEILSRKENTHHNLDNFIAYL